VTDKIDKDSVRATAVFGSIPTGLIQK